MASDDLVETKTPVFTEEEVYMIVGYVAERLGIAQDVAEETDSAIRTVLSRV